MFQIHAGANNQVEKIMFNPVKEGSIDDSLILFFNNLDLNDRINVPYLSDGTFELIMAQKN